GRGAARHLLVGHHADLLLADRGRGGPHLPAAAVPAGVRGLPEEHQALRPRGRARRLLRLGPASTAVEGLTGLSRGRAGRVPAAVAPGRSPTGAGAGSSRWPSL